MPLYLIRPPAVLADVKIFLNLASASVIALYEAP
jgi:hypothetical protein